MIAAMGVDEPAITVVQVEIAGQLFRAEFSGKAAVAVPLLFGQETDGHEPPRSPGEAFAKLTSSARKPKPSYFRRISFAKVSRKR